MFPFNRTRLLSLPVLILPALLATSGCSRPQPTAEQLAGPSTPLTALHVGPTPAGGSSEAVTGSGAGGSAAAGVQFGRVGSSLESPTLPDQPAGITYSRMSPVGSSGSGGGDRGNPIPPDVSLAAPPDAAPKRAPAPAGRSDKPVPAGSIVQPPVVAGRTRDISPTLH